MESTLKNQNTWNAAKYDNQANITACKIKDRITPNIIRYKLIKCKYVE